MDKKYLRREFETWVSRNLKNPNFMTRDGKYTNNVTAYLWALFGYSFTLGLEEGIAYGIKDDTAQDKRFKKIEDEFLSKQYARLVDIKTPSTDRRSWKPGRKDSP